jgi:hypothetical protein
MTEETNSGTATQTTCSCPYCQPVCPHCGRPYDYSPWRVYPYVPYYPWSPYPYYTFTYNTGGGVTTSGGLLNSPSRIAEEWSQLAVSDFWKLYNSELAKYQSSRMDKLRTDQIDKILYTQGEVNALGWVTNLPNRILTELAEQSKKGE